jgi:hypothetical protein
MKCGTILLTATMMILSASLAFSGHGSWHHGDQGFSSMDTDNDGKVSSDEYLAPFERWDADNDGALSMEEWISNHGGRKGKGNKGYGGKNYPCMSRVDTDSDGVVSAGEFEAVYPDMAKSHPMLDLNKDGVVDGDEWAKFRQMHTKEACPRTSN